MTELGRLRLLLAGFVLALAVPGAVLIRHAYSQLHWQAFFAARLNAQSASEQIDQALVERLLRQVTVPMDTANQQRAALGANAALAEELVSPAGSSRAGGLLGLFEVDPDGRLRFPGGGRPDPQSGPADRLEDIQRVLLNNELLAPSAGRVSPPNRSPRESSPAVAAERQASPAAASDVPGAYLSPAQPEPATSRFDRLSDDAVQQTLVRKRANYGQVEDLKLDQSLDQQASSRREKESSSVDIAEDAVLDAVVTTSAVPADAAEETLQESAGAEFRAITAFEVDAEPFQFSLLDSGHFALFRSIWRPEGRTVQGALYEAEALLSELRLEINAAALDGVQVLVAYGGTVLDVVGSAAKPAARPVSPAGSSSIAAGDGPAAATLASGASGQLLYRTRLTPPLSNLELVYYAEQLPLGAGLNLLLWLSLTLALVLLGGALALYRLGLGQLQLARQQRDFVSAVSHELKTPLTSIRMYGEMLTSGLAPTEKQPQYFQYIFDESERLSRLIDNVLQLARFDRGEATFNASPLTVGELLDLVRSRISSQVTAAGFELVIDEGSAGSSRLAVDADAMLQLFINLTDNALKFSRGSDRQRIEIGARDEASSVVLWVRDYGPGISPDQIGKIFRLFYRTESELTRDTIGTGIGLSLVQQIVTAMNGSIDVINARPGARFEVNLPRLAP
ncbi:MAG: HAMP domain-containing sensor histidine kinase [Pseudomonadota bacterium]